MPLDEYKYSRFVTIKEAAELYRCHHSTIRRAMKRGAIKNHALPGSRRILLSLDDLSHWSAQEMTLLP